MSFDKNKIDEGIKTAQLPFMKCLEEIGKRVVGQKNVLEGMLMGILAGGHVLLEGVPGLAKTLAVKTISDVFTASFKRIQFTPDLLPADLTGTMVYRPQTGEFIPKKGPLFANIVLADEINRAPAKVQSALLEAMEEKQVTIGEQTFPLPKPFFVLATQNPIEQEGTYPLPEAELDRFILKISIHYPNFQEEVEIVKRIGIDRDIPVNKIMEQESIIKLKNLIDSIKVDERIIEYIVALVAISREKARSKAPFVRYIEYGASPRASIYIYRCAKIYAFLNGRAFVIPEDIKAVAYPVLRHRIILNYEAESEGLTTDNVISEILNFVNVP
ncbi:MAG: MoxR family ATPase [Spirochaetales bacterium]|nr:MoxR family ATPase [Spirochaetales bacterium]